MIGYYGQVSYAGYWPLDDEWPPQVIGVLPLWRNRVTGEVAEIASPFIIDPSVLPASSGGSGSDTFAFWIGS